MDNLTENERKRFEILTKIREMIASDYKYKDIASILGISVRTVIRYKDCDPLRQCHLERTSRKKEICKYNENAFDFKKKSIENVRFKTFAR